MLKHLCLGFKGFVRWLCLIFGYQLWSNTPWRWSYYFYQIFSERNVLSEGKGNDSNKAVSEMFWVAMNFAWKWKGVNFWKGKKSSFSHIAEFFLLAQRLSRECRLTLRDFRTHLPLSITKINHFSAYIEKKKFHCCFLVSCIITAAMIHFHARKLLTAWLCCGFYWMMHSARHILQRVYSLFATRKRWHKRTGWDTLSLGFLSNLLAPSLLFSPRLKLPLVSFEIICGN